MGGKKDIEQETRREERNTEERKQEKEDGEK